MMSMLPPLNPSTCSGRVDARYRLMTLCRDLMATLGGLHTPWSHASANAGFTEVISLFRSSVTRYIITRCTYNSCIYNIPRVVGFFSDERAPVQGLPKPQKRSWCEPHDPARKTRDTSHKVRTMIDCAAPLWLMAIRAADEITPRHVP